MDPHDDNLTYNVHDNLVKNAGEFQVMSLRGGPFAGIPFRLTHVKVTKDAQLEYAYDLYHGNDPEFDSAGFDDALGQFLIESLTQLAHEERHRIHVTDDLVNDVHIIETDY